MQPLPPRSPRSAPRWRARSSPTAKDITHVVELRIEGAASDADALRVAKAIAHSPLVKTAWAGNDPNWGRLAAAIGYSGAQIDPDRFDISFGELPICRNGGRAPEFDEATAHAYISQTEFSISIHLHQGEGACVFWTTDLTTSTSTSTPTTRHSNAPDASSLVPHLPNPVPSGLRRPFHLQSQQP